MKRRPEQTEGDYEATPNAFVGARRTSAQQTAHAIEPFFASGGMSYWISDSSEGFYPNSAGVQFVTSVYVPRGRQGFLKELRVAPYCPAPLCDPWTTSGAVNQAASWRVWDREDVGSEAPLPFMGDVWRMPLGWEAAWDNESETLPVWTWSLRLIQGDVMRLRGQGYMNIPPFSTADPASWYLAPNVAVPASAYPAGLPGVAVGPQWDSQRLQILPTDKVAMHVPIPQDVTLCLFTRWTQSTVMPLAANQSGDLAILSGSQYNAGRLPPIGPSMGSLLGYTQAINSNAARENLELGWGG